MVDRIKIEPYRNSLAYECKRHKEYVHSKDGMFEEGEMVQWMGRKKKHRGTVAEVVPPHRYPRMWPGLRVRGYYRETESYVILDEQGKYFWPRVGLLGNVSR